MRARRRKQKNEIIYRHIGLSIQNRIGLQIYGVIGASPKLFSLAQSLAGLEPGSSHPCMDAAVDVSQVGVQARIFHAPPLNLSEAPRPGGTPKLSLRYTKKKESMGANKKDEEFEEIKNTKENLVDKFTQELKAIGGQIYRVTSYDLTDSVESGTWRIRHRFGIGSQL